MSTFEVSGGTARLNLTLSGGTIAIGGSPIAQVDLPTSATVVFPPNGVPYFDLFEFATMPPPPIGFRFSKRTRIVDSVEGSTTINVGSGFQILPMTGLPVSGVNHYTLQGSFRIINIPTIGGDSIIHGTWYNWFEDYFIEYEPFRITDDITPFTDTNGNQSLTVAIGMGNAVFRWDQTPTSSILNFLTFTTFSTQPITPFTDSQWYEFLIEVNHTVASLTIWPQGGTQPAPQTTIACTDQSAGDITCRMDIISQTSGVVTLEIGQLFFCDLGDASNVVFAITGSGAPDA